MDLHGLAPTLRFDFVQAIPAGQLAFNGTLLNTRYDFVSFPQCGVLAFVGLAPSIAVPKIIELSATTRAADVLTATTRPADILTGTS